MRWRIFLNKGMKLRSIKAFMVHYIRNISYDTKIK
ncbi:hypothetical protein CLROS_000330 [Clostridium felsineum]|uniref:Uncharacterized protein n=1 Tax=Clostridium felsineum TaxID=36839 RepID=A0A1S8L6U7_9CLOT|nr:hypothetical protein CLAUR_026400 [Clostridium felsineum]URZ04724.1 hypothetical protein CLROS_000330 [Clostridium felsineum]URZ09697.1 hypothetical protein CROST_003900 [Clostridium felsineum]